MGLSLALCIGFYVPAYSMKVKEKKNVHQKKEHSVDKPMVSKTAKFLSLCGLAGSVAAWSWTNGWDLKKTIKPLAGAGALLSLVGTVMLFSVDPIRKRIEKFVTEHISKPLKMVVNLVNGIKDKVTGTKRKFEKFRKKLENANPKNWKITKKVKKVGKKILGWFNKEKKDKDICEKRGQLLKSICRVDKTNDKNKLLESVCQKNESTENKTDKDVMIQSLMKTTRVVYDEDEDIVYFEKDNQLENSNEWCAITVDGQHGLIFYSKVKV